MEEKNAKPCFLEVPTPSNECSTSLLTTVNTRLEAYTQVVTALPLSLSQAHPLSQLESALAFNKRSCLYCSSTVLSLSLNSFSGGDQEPLETSLGQAE